ncbi:MAG: hypothetical protein COB37_08550 [Kordiimonadales bacterium]|nr:MAG: hypothetical protein COB37_08550 [Kordiimonadales bacterium]
MGIHILAVDDSKTIRDIVAFTLEQAGYSVGLAVDGVDALDKLNKEDFDLVITDFNMPNMDGLELIETIKAKEDWKTKPVLVLSTESDAELKNRARAAGATGWIVKPLDPTALIKVVKKVCG